MNRVSNRMKSVAIALAMLAAMQLAAQDLAVPGFTKESFALLKQRAEAGDAKAQELYKKVVEANRELLGAVAEAATEKAALDTAKAEIQESEASTGVVTAGMLNEVVDPFVVNGFFVGMPLADAEARLARLLPGRKVSRRPPGGNLALTKQRGLEGLWIDGADEPFCLAEDDRVVRLLIPGPLVVDWMGLQPSSYEGRAKEIARKFGYVDTYGIPVVETMVFSVPGLVEVYSFQIAEYLVSIPEAKKENFEKSGYGKGHALQFKQRLYRLGEEGRVTYFGEAGGLSDVGVTKQGRNPYFEGWLKNIRALGENASEGTLRIDAKDFKMPDEKRGSSADESPQEFFAPKNSDNAELTGLFGVKFGLTMLADHPCETNNLFSLAYEYVPAKPFNEFTDYVVFASPVTRTVFQVRGIHTCETRAEAEAKVAEVGPLLELKFGRRLQNQNGGKIMRFTGGDRIEIEIVPGDSGYRVVIDAVSKKYDVQDTEEALSLKDAFAKSLIAPLGKTPDEVLSASSARQMNEYGQYMAPVPGELRALGFSSYVLHPLHNTGRIGGAKATFVGDAPSCANVYERVKSQLQLIFGPVVREETSRKVDFMTTIGDTRCKFLLEFLPSKKRVVLVIGDYGEFTADALKAAADDLDAL